MGLGFVLRGHCTADAPGMGGCKRAKVRGKCSGEPLLPGLVDGFFSGYLVWCGMLQLVPRAIR